MIDYNKHAYSKVGSYSNVLYEWHPTERDRADTWQIELHNKIAGIIHKMAMAHPEWMIVMRGGGSHSDRQTKLNVHDARVICEGEVIGSLEVDLWKTGEPIEVNCSAIQAKRQRRGGAWTTKVEKAYKLVEQNFCARSIFDRLKTGRGEVRSFTGSQSWGEQRKFSDAMGKLHEPLAAYIHNNIETLKAALPVAYHAQLEAVPELARRLTEANIVANAASYDSGTYVLIREGKYYVMKGGDDSYETLSSEELPADIATKVGMLKAFDTNDEIVEGVGVRMASGIYFVL